MCTDMWKVGLKKEAIKTASRCEASCLIMALPLIRLPPLSEPVMSRAVKETRRSNASVTMSR